MMCLDLVKYIENSLDDGSYFSRQDKDPKHLVKATKELFKVEYPQPVT